MDDISLSEGFSLFLILNLDQVTFNELDILE